MHLLIASSGLAWFDDPPDFFGDEPPQAAIAIAQTSAMAIALNR